MYLTQKIYLTHNFNTKFIILNSLTYTIRTKERILLSKSQ